MSRCRTLTLLILIALSASGCATAPTKPVSIDKVPFRERGATQTEGTARVTAAVPSAEETRALFGLPLYQRRIQPVWLNIENLGDDTLSFMNVGLDPEYFTPIESSFIGHNGSINDVTNQYFFSRGIQLFVPPGESRAGYMFTQLDEGTKSFNVDLFTAARDYISFTFFIPVPGLRLDHYEVDFDTLYAADEYRELDAPALIRELESLPCCTTDEAGRDLGDPLNIVVIGNLQDVYYAFLRAQWDETETIYSGSALRTATSFLFGGEYRYSPVSPLYVFGRAQDVAFQRARGNIHERNHLRLWATPLRFEGQHVWIGQISRDIGVRFTTRTIFTHKIDADVDETREYLLENLAYAQALARFGYVGGVGAASFDKPRGNLTGDPYFTDGYRVVLNVSSHPVAIDDLERLDWANPTD